MQELSPKLKAVKRPKRIFRGVQGPLVRFCPLSMFPGRVVKKEDVLFWQPPFLVLNVFLSERDESLYPFS